MSAPTQAARDAAERIARMLRDHPTLCERSVADVIQSACDASAEASISMLRVVLEKDRAAIAAMKKDAPWYEPGNEVLDLHKRIESVLAREDTKI